MLVAPSYRTWAGAGASVRLPSQARASRTVAARARCRPSRRCRVSPMRHSPGPPRLAMRTVSAAAPQETGRGGERRGPLLQSAAMSRTQRLPDRAERIRALLEAGDHAGARDEARAVLADAGAPERERAAAAEALGSLAPDRGAVLAGAVGVAIAIALAAGVLLRG